MPFALMFLILFDALFLGSGFVAARLAPTAPPYLLTDASEGAGLLLSAFILARMHWFKVVGFNARREWRDLRVLWVPAVLGAFLLVSVVPVVGRASTPLAISLTLSTVLIGFSEESSIRGVVLQSLLRLGAKKAILLSALLFGILHFNNLIQAGVGGDLQSVGVAVVFAFLVGIGLGAFRIRTNTIWPIVVFHSVSDLPGLFTVNTVGYASVFNPPTALLLIALGAVLAFYGLFVVRNRP